MCLLYIDGSADHGLGLHLSDLRISHSQTQATVTHHRVELMQRSNDGLDLLNALALCLSQLLNIFFLSGNELMQRGIQETDGYRAALQRLIQLLKVALLIRQDLLQSSLALLNGVRANHLTESSNSVFLKEHMLGTAQTDTLSAQLTSLLGVCGGVCVGAYFQYTELISPAHDTTKVAGNGCVLGCDNTVINITGRTVNGDVVALVIGLACQSELLVGLVHYNVAAAGYAAGTHTTSNNGSVRSHTAANSQDALRSLHAGDVLGRSLQTNQNHLLASLVPLHSVISGEHNLTASSAGRSAQALTGRGSSLNGGSVKLRVQQGVQVTGIDHSNGFFFRSHALVYQIASDLQSSLSGTLTVTGLQHEQLTVLHGELHVLHISVMVLQSLANLGELCESLGELLLHLLNVHRCTHTSHYVLALGIGQELTEEALGAGSGVTGKGNAGAAVIAHVTKGHGLHVNGSTPRIRNVVVTTIYICAGVVPRTEHSLDGTHQLLLRIRGEVLADLGLVLGLELRSQLLQIVSVQLHILGNALFGLHLIDELLKVLLTHFHNHVGIHLDKSSVAVPSPTGITGLGSDGVHNILVQTQVQDGVHHAWHGSSCAGANGYQQRILLVAELLAGDLFHLYDILVDLIHDFRIDLAAVLIILGAGLSRDGEALGHRQADVGHLGQVSTLTAEKLSHVCITLREEVAILFCH